MRGASLTAGRAILCGTSLVGVLDICDAIVYMAFKGVGPMRVFQSVAAGLLGREAFQGGLPTATLGGALHFFNAACVFTVFFLASRRLGALTRHPVAWGLAYGVAVFFVMYGIVLPLASIHVRYTLPVLVNGIVGHALLVGLPAALVTERVPVEVREGRRAA